MIDARKVSGLTQKELSERTGIAQADISKLENGLSYGQLMRTIPCGQVMHYGQLAEQLGRPGAARAVGAANGSNPISIVVPCHRVIGRNGTMTGYAGGVQRKEWLLRHEGYLLL